jgi:hypothetical protein
MHRQQLLQQAILILVDQQGFADAQSLRESIRS